MDLIKGSYDEELFLQLGLLILKDSSDKSELIAHFSNLLMNSNNDEFLIYYSAFLLGWIQTEQSIDSLRLNLHHPSPIVREACVFVLGQVAERENAEELLLRLYDSDERVRRMAATAIGWAGGDFHIDLMEEKKILFDPCLYEEVISILRQIGSEKANQTLDMVNAFIIEHPRRAED